MHEDWMAFQGKVGTAHSLAFQYGLRVAGAHRISVIAASSIRSRAGQPPVLLSPSRAHFSLSIGGDTLELGVGVPRGRLVVGDQDGWDLPIELDLTPLAVAHIEAWRDARPFTLRVWVDYSADIVGAGRLPPEENRVLFTQDVSRDSWLAVLEQARFGRSLFIELALPADLPDDLRRAVPHLEEAVDKQSHGYHADALTACRKALEFIAGGPYAQALSDEAKSLIRAMQDNQRRATLNDRAAVVLTALRVYTNAGSHPGAPVSRHHAQLAIGGTAALIQALASGHP